MRSTFLTTPFSTTTIRRGGGTHGSPLFPSASIATLANTREQAMTASIGIASALRSKRFARSFTRSPFSSGP